MLVASNGSGSFEFSKRWNSTLKLSSLQQINTIYRFIIQLHFVEYK